DPNNMSAGDARRRVYAQLFAGDSDEINGPAHGSAPPKLFPSLVASGGLLFSRITSPCARQGKREFRRFVACGCRPRGAAFGIPFFPRLGRGKGGGRGLGVRGG